MTAKDAAVAIRLAQIDARLDRAAGITHEWQGPIESSEAARLRRLSRRPIYLDDNGQPLAIQPDPRATTR